MLDMNQSYYVKSVFYGNYVKEIMLPLQILKNNIRNKSGIKNIGKNDKKMVHNNIRSKCSFIRKVYHNFSDSKNLSFLTLTYALNVNDVKRCKKDLAKFFKNIKYWLLVNKNRDLKYVYTYEYQSRGAVHFHILMDYKFKNELILKNWLHGINKNLKVQANTQEFVAQYCSKFITANYISKEFVNEKSFNQYDLNLKSYQFSYNCKNPYIEKTISSLSLQNIINKAQNAEHIKFMKAKINEMKSSMIGASYDYKLSNYQKNKFSFRLLV